MSESLASSDAAKLHECLVIEEELENKGVSLI